MHVLIADDNPLTRRRLEVVVRKWGWEPQSVLDGLQAWEALQTDNPPRLAILDWRMPGLDGPEICRRVRELGDERYTFLILLTSSDGQNALVEGLKAGADDFIRKPFHADELEQRLRTGRRIIELQDHLLAARERLRLQATQDSLTGLWNRSEIMRFFEDEQMRRQRTQRPLGLLLLDIDYFKRVNDSWGHLAGDEALRRVSKVVGETCRSMDRVGRFGGEEFLVVLPETSGADSCRVAERIRQAVEAISIPVTGGDNSTQELCVTISIGVSTIEAGQNLSTIDALHRADLALYEAKAAGRNCVCESSDRSSASRRTPLTKPNPQDAVATR